MKKEERKIILLPLPCIECCKIIGFVPSDYRPKEAYCRECKIKKFGID